MKTLTCIFLIAMYLGAYAQKLPNVQLTSLHTPANVKIDGKLTEWGNNLQAYNKAERLEYTMANDADNLYLCFRSKDVRTIAKIFAGGVTLSINTNNKKEATGAAVTFPHSNTGWVSTPTGLKTSNFMRTDDSLTTTAAIKQIRFIKVKNFDGAKDTLLSIYNDQGVQTKLLYGNKALVCEMLIPKKFLGLTNSSTKAFAYQIRLNGLKQPDIPGAAPVSTTINPERPLTHPLNILVEISAPSDFWGEYTLAK